VEFQPDTVGGNLNWDRTDDGGEKRGGENARAWTNKSAREETGAAGSHTQDNEGNDSSRTHAAEQHKRDVP
jgi:hypothetical protein